MYRVAPLAFVMAVIGCGSKVNLDTTVTVQPGETRKLIVDPPKKEQKVHLEISSSTKVNVLILLSKNEETIERDLAKARPNLPSSVLGGKLDTQSHTEDVTIPAGEQFIVWIQCLGSKTAEVKVKLNSL